MSTTKTIRERLTALDLQDKFKRSMDGNINGGKIMTLATRLAGAVGSIDHYAETMKENPSGFIGASVFVVKQSIVIEELLDPMERIATGELKTENFIQHKISEYEHLIFLGHSVSQNNSNPSINLATLERHKVWCDILLVLKAK